jgi:hypothetical protein
LFLQEQIKGIIIYDPILHRRVGREVRGGKGLMARVGNMSSGTCMPSSVILCQLDSQKIPK